MNENHIKFINYCIKLFKENRGEQLPHVDSFTHQ